MPAHSQYDTHEPAASDTSASRACTQAGAFALLLAAFLIVLIPNWLDRPREVALAQYVTYREALAEQVGLLDADQGWHIFLAGHDENKVESMSLSSLSQAVISYASSAAPTARPAEPTRKEPTAAPPPEPPRSSPRSPGAPAAPQDAVATIVGPVGTISSIISLLEKLNDPKVLTQSMRESNYFSNSIMRWGDKRSEMIAENVFQHSCSTLPFVETTLRPGELVPDYYAPLLKRDAMLNCLTLADVRQLANFELPTFANPFLQDGRIKKELEIRPGALPADLFTATLSVQLLLAITLLYFAAFAREAVASERFPARGTIFSAFMRSRITLASMLLALFAPLLASLAVSMVSAKFWLLALNVPILFANVLAYRVLQERKYFSALLKHRPTL